MRSCASADSSTNKAVINDAQNNAAASLGQNLLGMSAILYREEKVVVKEGLDLTAEQVGAICSVDE
jgi:hypothetical protein